MTDEQIEEARFQHWVQRIRNRALVLANSPSRVAAACNVVGEPIGMWDYANERHVCLRVYPETMRG